MALAAIKVRKWDMKNYERKKVFQKKLASQYGLKDSVEL